VETRMYSQTSSVTGKFNSRIEQYEINNEYDHVQTAVQDSAEVVYNQIEVTLTLTMWVVLMISRQKGR
jgi:predicted metal-binding membrane protein